MNHELKEALRSVLKEELQPVHHRLEGLEQHIDGMAQRMNGLDQHMDGMAQRMNGMGEHMNGLNQRIDGLDQSINGLGQRMYGIEHLLKEFKTEQITFQKNIIESLGQYTEKIAEHVDVKTEVLNKRVYALETEVERLTRQ